MGNRLPGFDLIKIIMKISYYKTIAVSFVLSTFLLSSCTGEDAECKNTKLLHLTTRSVDSDPDDIKNDVKLYFFNSDHKLEKIVKTTLNAETENDGAKDYTIIAMGYSSDVEQPNIALGTPIDEAEIILSTTSFDDVNVSVTSGDIFYGRLEVKKEDRNVKEIIWLRRKVAALTLITKNLKSELSTTDEDFSYVVRETYNTLDFEGTFKGEKISYKPNTYFSPGKENFIAPMFYTYASSPEDQTIYIDIYKGNVLIKTYSVDKEDEPKILSEGKHTIVIIDFTNNGNDGSMNITCTVNDWLDGDITEGFQ